MAWAALVLGAACAGGPREAGRPPEPAPGYEWRLPRGFPPPLIPADNPMSAAKVELGRRLFYDQRLSANGTLPCGGCHRQERAFTDGRPRAVGVTGERHPRSTMSLANVAYNALYTWADPRIESLEQQALIPLLNRAPIEMGLAGREEAALADLRGDPTYVRLFATSFPAAGDPITLANTVKAIVSFVRTLVSGDSPYDRLVYYGESEAISPAAKRGMRLFFSERLRCSRCHGGFNFSAAVTYLGGPRPVVGFHNTGLYDLGAGAYPPLDRGLITVTGERSDMGRFRAPTLRNIAVTGPYMHDGSIGSLDEVIDHYAAGGRAGRRSPLRSPLVSGFRLAPGEKQDLVAFLTSLTDDAFLVDPDLADPWR